MKNLVQEFKEFAIKGNMIDIAIGVIIGAAFNKVVEAIVKQIFMPPLSFLTDGVSWENKKWVLRESHKSGDKTIDEIAVGYGKLVEVSIDFLIIAITVFIVVKFMNSLRNKAEEPSNTEEKTPKNIELLNRIGDLIEKQNTLLEQNTPKK